MCCQVNEWILLINKFLIFNVFYVIYNTVAVGCLVISSAITMTVPFALGKILDIIFNKTETTISSAETLASFCQILCGIFIIGGVANFGRVYLFNSACKY